MFPLMCWNCMEEQYAETGDVPQLGSLLKQDGTQTAVAVWFGYTICRHHALEMLALLRGRTEMGRAE
jgi:hypothetical protein